MNGHPVHKAYVGVLPQVSSEDHPYVVCMWKGELVTIEQGWTKYKQSGNSIYLDNAPGDGRTVQYELDPNYPDIAIRRYPKASIEELKLAKEQGAPWLQYVFMPGDRLADFTTDVKVTAGKGLTFASDQSYLSTETQILNKAIAAITGERAESYGLAEDSFETIAQLWNTYAGTDLDAEDVAMMLVLMKVARQMYKHKDDNLIDIAGYAALAARIHDKANGSA